MNRIRLILLVIIGLFGLHIRAQTWIYLDIRDLNLMKKSYQMNNEYGLMYSFYVDYAKVL